jgi:hypothetical protein
MSILLLSGSLASGPSTGTAWSAGGGAAEPWFKVEPAADRWTWTVPQPPSAGAAADIRAIAVSPGGDVLVAGTALGPLSLGGERRFRGPGLHHFLARVSAEGRLRWVRRIEPSDDRRRGGVTAMTGTPDDGLVIAGAFRLPPGPPAELAKLASDGRVVWTAPGSGGPDGRGAFLDGASEAMDLFVDQTGQIMIVGCRRNRSGGKGLQASEWFDGGFVARYSPRGSRSSVVPWRGQRGLSPATGVDEPLDRDCVSGIAGAPTGDLYLVGTFSGPLGFGGQALNAPGGTFMARLSPRGELIWARLLSATGFWLPRLRRTSTGGLVITGDVASGDGPTEPRVALFDEEGRRRWSRPGERGGYQMFGEHLLVSADGEEPVWAGTFKARTSEKEPVPEPGFLARLGADGALRSADALPPGCIATALAGRWAAGRCEASERAHPSLLFLRSAGSAPP